MKFLSKEKQIDMANQLSLKSRDIDVVLYNILDESLPKEFMLDSLMMYINKDGGFGNGLYIDNYNPNSSVYQVYEAFRLLDLSGFDKSCDDELFKDIINKASNYLYNRNVLVNHLWNPNVISNKDFPHNIIFDDTDENLKLFGLHPTFALVGYTLKFFNETKAYYKKALKMANKLIELYLAKEEVTKYDLISVDSFINSVKNLNLFDSEIVKLENKLINDSLKLIDLDIISPLDIIYVKDNKLDSLRNEALDKLIDSVKDFGMWDYKTNWGTDKYPEEDSANLKWIGANSANNYYLLKYYERLEK